MNRRALLNGAAAAIVGAVALGVNESPYVAAGVYALWSTDGVNWREAPVNAAGAVTLPIAAAGQDVTIRYHHRVRFDEETCPIVAGPATVDDLQLGLSGMNVPPGEELT